MNEEQGYDIEKVASKLAYKIAQLELNLANETVQKEFYIEEYHKLKAQVENNDD